jgi:hypothetical protein
VGGRPAVSIQPMDLATYRSCSFKEKRAVLGAFWTGHPADSEKVNQAAREYGPYATALIAVISLELITISVALLVSGSWWTWVGVVATALSLLSLRWTRVCQLRARSVGAGA